MFEINEYFMCTKKGISKIKRKRRKRKMLTESCKK